MLTQGRGVRWHLPFRPVGLSPVFNHFSRGGGRLPRHAFPPISSAPVSRNCGAAYVRFPLNYHTAWAHRLTNGSFQQDSALWSSHLEYSVTMPLGRSTGADSVSTRSAGRSRFLCVGTLDSQRLPFVPESASYGYWQAAGDFTGKIRGPDSPV